MKKILIVCLFLLTGCLKKTQYNLYIYYAKTCPICHEMMNKVIPLVEDEYDESVNIIEMDIDQEESLDAYAKTCSLLDGYYVDEDSGQVPLLVLDGYFALFGYDIGTEREVFNAIEEAINGENITFDFENIYYFQDGKTFH